MMTPCAPVRVTGTALASPLGNSLAAATAALRAGLVPLHKSHRFPEFSDFTLGEVDVSAFASVADWDSRFHRMVVGTLQKLAQETAVFSRYAPEEIGFYFGTSTAGMESATGSLHDYLAAHHHPTIIHRLVRQLFPIEGFGTIVTTACSSGALAIAMGQSALARGQIKACIVGGFDILCPITIAGFRSLQILDAELCRPFGPGRQGINLAEGGAFLLLENMRANVETLAYLQSSGASSDGFHITRPDPEGLGMELSLRQALMRAGLSTVSYVNAHGTGTQANDDAEAKAIARVFPHGVPVSSTKSFHGHALAGTGAIEAALSIAAITEQTIWPGRDVENTTVTLVRKVRAHPVNTVLSNSFGFGGNNVSLIFSRGPHV